MKIYIAGPMTGLPEWNFPAFDAAAEILRLDGHDPVNPADLDREIGFDPRQTETVGPAFLRDAMRRDLTAICECDGIAMLPGWERSGGARVEHALAVHLGLHVRYL